MIHSFAVFEWSSIFHLASVSEVEDSNRGNGYQPAKECKSWFGRHSENRPLLSAGSILKRTCVIFNPTARGEKANRFREHLGGLSNQCALKPTRSAGDGRPLAAQAVREGFEQIIAAGGDGTVNEVLNGMGDASEGFRQSCLGVLPLGTVNVFAREIGIPPNFKAAWSIIETGHHKVIDLPQAEWLSNGKNMRRLFAQMAGAGLDSKAVEMVDLKQKKMLGAFAYVLAFYKAFKGPSDRIQVSNGQETFEGDLVLIGNGRYYGGPYRLFPAADLRDGLLEVSIFPQASWSSFARCGWGLITDNLYKSGRVKYLRGESICLQSDSVVPFHLEGENAGTLPVRFSVRREGLRVIAP
jgi:YegS/Rv2252/BmrU family lipid kinase